MSKRMAAMDKAKAFMLGMLASAFIFASLVYVSEEAYQDELAKINRAKHKVVNWYGSVPPLKEINK